MPINVLNELMPIISLKKYLSYAKEEAVTTKLNDGSEAKIQQSSG